MSKCIHLSESKHFKCWYSWCCAPTFGWTFQCECTLPRVHVLEKLSSQHQSYHLDRTDTQVKLYHSEFQRSLPFYCWSARSYTMLMDEQSACYQLIWYWLFLSPGFCFNNDDAACHRVPHRMYYYSVQKMCSVRLQINTRGIKSARLNYDTTLHKHCNKLDLPL